MAPDGSAPANGFESIIGAKAPTLQRKDAYCGLAGNMAQTTEAHGDKLNRRQANSILG
jgi:hypothetical protein